MSRCSCQNPCTCFFEYDGDRPNTVYTLPFKYGRYSTTRTGSGTSADPYIIEFLDSEEFRVEAGQAHSSGDQIITSGTSTHLAANGINTIDYETPHEIFEGFELLLGLGPVIPTSHRFWYVTAEATFVNNGQAGGLRRIYVRWDPPGNYGNVGSYIVIAGNSSTGLPAGVEDITLSCSGMSPFANTVDLSDALANGLGGNYTIYVLQSSTANMTIRNVKITFVAI